MINLSYKISIERERRARYRNPPIFAAISYTISKESLDSLYHQRALTRLSILNIDTTETLNLSFEEGKLSLLLWFPRATIYFSIRKNRKFPNLSLLLFLLYLNSRMKVFWTRSNSKADRKHAEKCIKECIFIPEFGWPLLLGLAEGAPSLASTSSAYAPCFSRSNITFVKISPVSRLISK